MKSGGHSDFNFNQHLAEKENKKNKKKVQEKDSNS